MSNYPKIHIKENNSRGPINSNHKKFVDNDKSIITVLCGILKTRRINVRAAEVYKQAKLSSPTFYLHYRSADDVRQQYEQRLRAELAYRVPKNASPRVFFTLLINLIIKHQQYFIAVSESCNNYLLTVIIKSYRKILVSSEIDERSFLFYLHHLQAILDGWLNFDLSKEPLIDDCIKELVRAKPPKNRQKTSSTKPRRRTKPTQKNQATASSRAKATQKAQGTANKLAKSSKNTTKP